jgi:phage FluMu protein Com
MSNFLDIRCPKCDATDQIDIAATVWLRVTEDGTDADESKDGHHDYTPRSNATCNACGYYGRLQDFEPED